MRHRRPDDFAEYVDQLHERQERMFYEVGLFLAVLDDRGKAHSLGSGAIMRDLRRAKRLRCLYRAAYDRWEAAGMP